MFLKIITTYYLKLSNLKFKSAAEEGYDSSTRRISYISCVKAIFDTGSKIKIVNKFPRKSSKIFLEFFKI